MLILDWVMDKIGYQKKPSYSWEQLLKEWEAEEIKPIRTAKKKPAVKKPVTKKTVRKKV
jgi:hypothetical protein